MQRINVVVSDRAKDSLLDYQRHRRIKRQDDALDEILINLGDGSA